MSLLYVGDVGASIVIQLNNTNIPAGATVDVIVQDPSGITQLWVLESGELNKTTGIITHKSKAGELPYEGEYQIQCREIDTSLQVNMRTTIDTFMVYRRLGLEVPTTLIGKYTVESS